MDSKIIGNQQARDILEKHIVGFSGFMFIIGPEGVGKTSHVIDALNSNNIEFTNYEVNKDSIYAARKVSFSGGPLLLLDNVDHCNDSVQDGLLKTIENEYDDGFSVIAILHDTGRITPALKSRIRNSIVFSELNKSDLEDFLIDNPSDNFCEKVFFGRPACYLHCVGNDSWSRLYDMILDHCNGKDISRSSFPPILSDLDTRISRICVDTICRHVCHHSSLKHIDRMKSILNFGSTILDSPSCNAELHWWGMLFDDGI